MNDEKKAKKELISEIKKLHKRIAKLEALEAEHKQVEEEQRERVKLYRTVLQKLPDIVYRINPDGHFTFLSNSVEILGYEPEELIGKHFSKIIHPDDVKSFSRFIALLKHKGKVTGDKNRPKLIDERRTGKRKTKDLEVRLIPKTLGRGKKEKIGTVTTLGDVSATGFYEADIHEKNKKFLGTLGIIRDITEHKLAEEKLRLFSQGVDSSIDGIAMGNPEGKITYVNEAFVRMFGHSREELIGKEISFIYPEDQLPKIEEALKATMKGGWTGELVGKRKNGELFPMMVSSSRVVDNEGKVIAHMASHRDITERKRVEEELIRMSDAVKMSTDSIVISDIEARIIDVNEATMKMYGTDNKKDLVGKNSFDLIAPEDREKALEGTKKVLEKGYLKDQEYTIITKDSDRIPVEMSASILKDTDGKPIGFVAITRDITNRKRAEERLKQHQEMLKASERELKNFSRRILSIREEEKKNLSISLHHEVGSLAVALSSNLSNIEEEIKDNDLKGALEVIEKGKTMLGKVIIRLKKMAVDLRPPDLDITGLPDALRVHFSNVTKQSGIEIDFSVDVDYKRITDDAAINLYRIVQEAINNVIKHSEAKKVEVELKSLKNGIELNVCDDGNGFDTGKSVREAKMRMGIRGMREMAESLGGTFNIKSIPGQGTEIAVTLANIETQK
ncbi:PAS domain S-box protein [candidate division WOR-3 bacterium]|nr:PAS domain S-box protein [candidate division WOR-3 bacterium]